MLSGTPNSNRRIEAEVANRFIRDISFSFSDTLTVNMSYIPPALTEFFHSPDDDDVLPYPQTFWVHSLLSCEPGERFEAQLMVDRGNVNHWPIELNTPSKCNIRFKTPFSREILPFLNASMGVIWSISGHVSTNTPDVLSMA